MSSKKRNWAFVLYPDSAPTDWRDKLRLSGLMSAVSPYHDKDVDPDGNPKKPHYHVIVVYNGPTTPKAVGTFSSSLNATIPIPLESVRGMYRYFTHKDNPEKHQYAASDISVYNGFNIDALIELTKLELDELKDSVIQFILDNDIFEYSDLLDNLRAFKLDAEYHVALNHTMLFSYYLNSRRNKIKENRKEKED